MGLTDALSGNTSVYESVGGKKKRKTKMRKCRGGKNNRKSNKKKSRSKNKQKIFYFM